MANFNLVLETRTLLASEDAKERMIKDIWPTVQRAAQNCPARGRIMTDFITFASPDQLFLRSGKGTVQRIMTLDLYKSQIDILYEPGNTFERHLGGPLVTSQRSLLEGLYHIVSKTTWLKELAYTNDPFEAGLDSRQVVALAKHINLFLRDHNPDLQRILLATIYAYSSIAELEGALRNPTTRQSLDPAGTLARSLAFSTSLTHPGILRKIAATSSSIAFMYSFWSDFCSWFCCFCAI